MVFALTFLVANVHNETYLYFCLRGN